MDRKKKINNNSVHDHKAIIVAQSLSSHNLPTDIPRKLFKLSKEAESIPVQILKYLGAYEIELFFCDIMAGEVMEYIYDSSDLAVGIYETCPQYPNTLCKSKIYPSQGFDDLIMKKWLNAQNEGICKYKLKVQCKRLVGSLGLVIQDKAQRLNRRKPQDFSNVNMPFDTTKFNFTKIKQEEVLFRIRKRVVPVANGNRFLVSMDTLQQNEGTKSDDFCIINVSPFAHGHVLLVPNLSHCRPQVLTSRAVEFALETQCLSRDSRFITVFNGLCAHASVNHLHLHSYYINAPSRPAGETSGFPHLMIQHPDLKCLYLAENCYVCHSLPVPGFVFQIRDISDIPVMAKRITTVTDYFVRENIAHNLSIARSTALMTKKPFNGEKRCVGRLDAVRVFLWPRISVAGAKNEEALNVGACELSGHVLVTDSLLYETATEEFLLRHVSKDALPADRFRSITKDVQNLLSSNQHFKQTQKEPDPAAQG